MNQSRSIFSSVLYAFTNVALATSCSHGQDHFLHLKSAKYSFISYEMKETNEHKEVHMHDEYTRKHKS